MAFGREEILTYALEQFGTEPEYLWAKYPGFCILRHTGNRKWYAALMKGMAKSKVGLSGDGTVDILNVKCDPRMLGSLLKTEGYLPAYHMNRENWVSIRLDGSVPWDAAVQLLTLSYDLTNRKTGRKKQQDGE